MSERNEEKILSSWRKNVAPWTCAIANGDISSRVQVTNQAILDAIFSATVKHLIDIGCGEGWLVRALAAHGVHAVGIDGVKQFIQNQANAENTQFLHVDYNSLSHQLFVQRFDVAVCNFSLFGDSSVRKLLQQIPLLLKKSSGRLIIQTLHPAFIESIETFQSGWRTGSWQGFPSSFVEPAPWYYRTVDDWLALFQSCGFELSSIAEPRVEISSDPVSIIFKLKA